MIDSQLSLFTSQPLVNLTYDKHESLDDRFERWIKANPQVLRAFLHFANQARERGRKHLGAKMIVERMRWEWMGQTAGDDFKLNNSFTSRLVRKAVAVKPELGVLFEFRSLRS